MLDVPEAQRILFAQVRPGPIITIALNDALHRTLAKPVHCDVDYPPFSRALMDGYAVNAQDVTAAPVKLRVAGQIPAGTVSDRALVRGEAMQINTGAPIPQGADAVVRVEGTELSEDGRTVLVCESVPPGRSITPQASYVRAEQQVLAVGQRIGPLEIAAAASAGAATVSVYRPPRVAVLTTGDELIDIDRVPTGAQIRNSNQALLGALIRTAFAEPVLLGAARDEPNAIREGILRGLTSDVLCITGGVSVGEFDFVPSVLAEIGVTVHFRKMMIKPGRPILFASASNGTLIFALPGNPVSAFVGFELLVRPAIAALEGRPGVVPREFTAALCGSLKPTENRRSYWPARARIGDDGQWEAAALSWQGSGDPFGMVSANALIMRPPKSAAAGNRDRVSILLLDRP